MQHNNQERTQPTPTQRNWKQHERRGKWDYVWKNYAKPFSPLALKEIRRKLGVLVDWQLVERRKEKEERLLDFDHDQNESREALMREERKIKRELVACLSSQTLSKDRLWANLCPLLLSFNHCHYLSLCSAHTHSTFLLTALVSCKNISVSLHRKLPFKHTYMQWNMDYSHLCSFNI